MRIKGIKNENIEKIYFPRHINGYNLVTTILLKDGRNLLCFGSILDHRNFPVAAGFDVLGNQRRRFLHHHLEHRKNHRHVPQDSEVSDEVFRVCGDEKRQAEIRCLADSFNRNRFLYDRIDLVAYYRLIPNSIRNLSKMHCLIDKIRQFLFSNSLKNS